ncbi:MAG TPA: hypothetical protein VLD58_08300 [Gemmatimonadales bacterium]|nr:hypothetical protein [Gemmatimonadales bacterium]
MPAESRDPDATGRLAVALAGMGVFNASTIILMYAGLPVFGPLNDLGVGTAAILQAMLAWRLRSRLGAPPLRIAVAAAAIGAAVAVVGSGLVISGATDWFVAGIVSTLGYAFLGIWLVSANRRARTKNSWPAPLASFGLLTGAITCSGFLALPAVGSGAGSPASAPWYVWAAYANGVGWFVLLPVWNFRLGRHLKRGSEGARGSPAA